MYYHKQRMFAIANAERLDTMNEGKTPASSAPGTKVHVLIKQLLVRKR